MTTRHIAWMVVAILLAVSTAQAATIHVDVANCPGPGSGSVGDPYCSIQTAIDNAVDTDEIVVTPGTYFEAINFLGKAVWLHSSDGPEVTIIDGTGNFHVVQCVSSEGSDTVLDGFTITGGDAHDGGFGINTFGGGMYNSLPASPTVTNCTFTGNSARLGGGMFNNNADPLVTDCVFVGNEADIRGGGMNNSSGSRPLVRNCTFTGNVVSGGTTSSGGGMANLQSSPTVINCAFIENSALGTVVGGGGGMHNSSDSSPTVTNCTFEGNITTRAGGGMVNSGDCNATVTDCTFTGNSAGDDGGGMYNDSSSPTLINCTFSGNMADFNGGGMHSQDPHGIATATNCTFSGNMALDGGGVYNVSGAVTTLTNCVVWNNDASQVVDAVVAYSNVQGGFPGTGNIDADPLFVDPDNSDLRLQAGSPCIDAGDNTAVPQDITTDLDGSPRFLEIPETPDTGNGTLPIVDMGAYESLGGGCLAVTSQEIVCHADGTTFTVNIDGLTACTGGTTQVTFTASGGAVGQELCFTTLVNDGGFCCSTEICVTIPDCTPVGKPSDLDGDGIVGMVDFLALLAAWGSCSDCANCPADFDGDCSVGILDLLILLGNWG